MDAETRIPEAVRATSPAAGHEVHANHPWGGVSLVCAVTADAAGGSRRGRRPPRRLLRAGW